MKHMALALVAAGAALAFPAFASSASATVGSLRVVAPNGDEVFPNTANLGFRAEPGPLQFSDSDTGHRCDAGSGAVTAGRAITVASRADQHYTFGLEGTFDASTGVPTFTEVDGQDLTPDPVTGKHFAEWIDGVPATRGACADALDDGDRVLFAWGTGGERVLRIDLPAYDPCRAVNPLRVTDEATGAPVEGAEVGDDLTDANGMVAPPSDGSPATKDGYIQSAEPNFAVPAIGCVRLQETLRLSFVEYTGNVCADPAARAVYRVTDEATGQPVEGASVLDQTTDASGLVRIGRAGLTLQAQKAGATASPAVFAPALPCPSGGPLPEAQPTMANDPTATPAVRTLALAAARAVRLGAIRFTATASTSGTYRVTARVGRVTLTRSVTVRGAAPVTFRLMPTAAQRRRLRRALRRGELTVTATITGYGRTAKASTTLRTRSRAGGGAGPALPQ